MTTYDIDGRDPRYVTPETLIDGRVIVRDAEGFPILDVGQVEAVKRETMARQTELLARTALPTETVTATIGRNVRAVCDELRDIDVLSPVPDPMTGTRSNVKRGRNKRGATAKVIHHGKQYAPVTDDASGLAAASDIELTRWADGFLRANADATTFSPVTGREYGPDAYPVLGLVLEAKQVMTPALHPVASMPVARGEDGKPVLAWNGARMSADDTYGIHGDACGVARQANDMSGWFSVPDDYLTGDSETRPHNAGERSLRWSSRVELRRTARKSDPAPMVHTFPDAEASAPWQTRVELLAHHVDPSLAWFGHSLIVRPAPERKTKATRPTTVKARDEQVKARADKVKREALAIPRDLVDAIDAVLITGEAGTVDTPRGTLTLTGRTANGRVRCTLSTPAGRADSWRPKANAGRIAAHIMR